MLKIIIVPVLVVASGASLMMIGLANAVGSSINPTKAVARAAAPGVQLSSAEERLFDAINKFRAQHGRSQVRINPRLMATARSRTNARYPSGHWVNGQQPPTAARSHGYRGNAIGENLAWGGTPESTVFDQWATSSGHRQNQLGNWRDVGVAVGDGSRGNARVAVFGR